MGEECLICKAPLEYLKEEIHEGRILDAAEEIIGEMN